MTGRPEHDLERGSVIPLYAGFGINNYCTSARVKAVGVSAGVPDVICFWERLGFNFYHETKIPLRRQTRAQWLFERDCARSNVPYVLGGVEEAMAFIAWMGVADIVGITMRVKAREKWPNPAEVQDMIHNWQHSVARHDASDKFGYQEEK